MLWAAAITGDSDAGFRATARQIVESLDNILKGKEAPVIEQQKVEAPEQKVETPTETPEQKADRERDDKGRFKAKEQDTQPPAKPDAQKAQEPPKVETKPAPTAAETVTPATKPEAEQKLDPRHSAAIAQANDERRKRQALEQELARLRAPQKQAPDVATDPQGFQQHINETLQTQTINMRVDISAAMARKQYQDYEAVMAEWPALIEANPALYQQAVQQELPADWAYNYVKQQLVLKEIGDPTAWRESEKARIRAELEAEIAQRPQVPARIAPAVPPPSLANASSGAAVVSTAKSWDGPTPFKNLIRR